MASLGNTFGATSKTYGASKNIWHEVKGAYPIGGKVSNLSDFSAGTVIPAGSMCVLDQSTHTVEIVMAGGAHEANVNGLLYNDIYVEAGVDNATATVVFAGEIYIDRVAQAISSSVLANLPMIVAIKEA